MKLKWFFIACSVSLISTAFAADPDWVLQSSKDVMTDEVSESLWLDSFSTHTYLGKKHKIQLILDCNKKKKDLVIAVANNKPLLSESVRSSSLIVETRLDADPMKEYRGFVNGSKFMYIPDPMFALDVIDLKHSKLLIRYRDILQTETVEFKLPQKSKKVAQYWMKCLSSNKQ